MERLMPESTPPVVTSKKIIAQFIPLTADELGSPEHVPQAKMSLNTKTIKIIIKRFIIYIFLNFLKTLYPYSTNPNITMNDITLNDLERFPGFDGVANSK